MRERTEAADDGKASEEDKDITTTSPSSPCRRRPSRRKRMITTSRACCAMTLVAVALMGGGGGGGGLRRLACHGFVTIDRVISSTPEGGSLSRRASPSPFEPPIGSLPHSGAVTSSRRRHPCLSVVDNDTSWLRRWPYGGRAEMGPRLSSSYSSTSARRRISTAAAASVAVDGEKEAIAADNDDKDDEDGDDNQDDEEYDDEDPFRPRTMTLPSSIAHYARFVVRTVRRDRLLRRLAPRSRRRLLARFKGALRRRWYGGLNREEMKLRDEEMLRCLELELDGAAKEEGETSDEKEEEKLSLTETLRRLNDSRRTLIQLVGYDSALLVPSFTFLVLGALATSVVPAYYSKCVTCLAAAATTSRSQVVDALTGLAVTSVLAALFTGLRGSLFWIAGSRGNYNVRVKLHRNLLSQEAAFFDSTETGILLSRLNNDVNKIGMVISFHVNVVLRQFAQFVFGSFYLLRISPKLSGYAFGGIVLVAYVSAVYGKFARGLAERVQDTFADASAVAETSFAMSETVRAFDGLETETTKYEGAQSRALNLEEVQAWAYGTHKFVSDVIESGLKCGLLFACWSMGRAGRLGTAELTTFMFYVNFVLESSNEVGDQWAKIQSAIGASTNVFELIRRVPAIRDPPRSGKKKKRRVEGEGERSDAKAAVDVEHVAPEATGGEEEITAVPNGDDGDGDAGRPVIALSDMSITYDAMDVPALSDVTLAVNSGDKVAIVGRSGSGKSSMLRTVLRFYDPSSGSVTLDGMDLTELTRRELAGKVTVVQQEPHLFPATLLENVLYGVPRDAVDDETGEAVYSPGWRDSVAEALGLAGLPVTGKAKNDLGLELDTRVGEGGRTLSGGQRQRVAIARSLIRGADVLLLDEPTAALDSKSEKTVVQALRAAMDTTKCMLMVTHRLGCVRSLGVNKVVVLERGRIAEMGHPEELLERKEGIYAQLAREQGIFPLSASSSFSSSEAEAEAASPQ